MSDQGRTRWTRPWFLALYGAALVVILGGAGAAGACKFFVACGLRNQHISDFEGHGRGPMTLPADLDADTYAQGLDYPTDLAFMPDGRLLVASKDGLVSVVPRGGGSPEPFLDLRSRVNSAYFRGIMVIAVDPDYRLHPFVYVGYTAGKGRKGRPTVARLARFTVRDGVAIEGSERFIVGSKGTTSCNALPKTADCLPSEHDHVGMDIAFTPGGELFVSTGDGGGEERVEEVAFHAQDLDTLGGKILRIDRNGNGRPDNPYWDGKPSSNRSRVWTVGLRNPFRLTLAPDRNDEPLVGDVGWQAWERLVFAGRGTNLGWPCYEASARTKQYRETKRCTEFYRRYRTAPTRSWIALAHPEAASMTGGTALNTATALPARLRGDYMFGDWSESTIYVASLASEAPKPSLLTTNAAGPVAFAIGPDGAVYYVAANVGEVRRLARAGS